MSRRELVGAVSGALVAVVGLLLGYYLNTVGSALVLTVVVTVISFVVVVAISAGLGYLIARG